MANEAMDVISLMIIWWMFEWNPCKISVAFNNGALKDYTEQLTQHIC